MFVPHAVTCIVRECSAGTIDHGPSCTTHHHSTSILKACSTIPPRGRVKHVEACGLSEMVTSVSKVHTEFGL
eukprot:358967-Chlamydomonas_euryale.AAC.2